MKFYFAYVVFCQQHINCTNFLLFSSDPGGGRLSISPSRDYSLNETVLSRYKLKQEWWDWKR